MDKNLKYSTNWYVNPEKEEVWLNRKSQQGWALERMWLGGLVCRFRHCSPGEYEYKIEFSQYQKRSQQWQDYQAFLSEMEIQCFYRCMGIEYLRKKADGIPFQLYTDHISNLLHYQRKARVFTFIFIEMILVFLLCLVAAILLLFGGGNRIALLWSTCTGLVSLCCGLWYLQVLIFYWKKITILRKSLDNSKEVLEEQDKPNRSPFLWFCVLANVIGAISGALVFGFFFW